MSQQYTPDAGTSTMLYDRLGRLTASQNAKQKALGFANDSLAWFSYTIYDVLGRIAEVGEVRNVSPCSKVFAAAIRKSTWISDLVYGTNHAATRHQLTSALVGLPPTPLVI